MPETITTTVYRLDELAESAKAAARAWYRQDAPFDDWHEFLFEDFVTVAAILGVDISTYAVRLYGGESRQAPRIWYSGFSSQGDGACYEGSYRYARGACAAIRAHAPKDDWLHAIADALAVVQRRNFYQLEAGIQYEGRDYHEYTMAIAVERSGPTGQDMTADAEEAVIEALRDLARWLYRQLEAEYEYQRADAQVDEAIRANDYSFTEDGTRFP